MKRGGKLWNRGRTGEKIQVGLDPNRLYVCMHIRQNVNKSELGIELIGRMFAKHLQDSRLHQQY